MRPWRPPGAVALIAFVAWAKRVREPLVDLALFRNRTYSAVNAATLTFGIAFAMMFFAFFFYMANVWHYTSPRAGLAIAPGSADGDPGGHRHRTPRRALRASPVPRRRFAALRGGGAVVPAGAGHEAAYVTQWLPGSLPERRGVGLVLPSLAGAAVSRLPAQHYAVGSAVNQATRQIGSVIGVAITVLLLGHGTVQRGDFDAVYGLHVALALLTAMICAFVKTRPVR